MYAGRLILPITKKEGKKMSTVALVELHVKPEAVEGVKAGLKKLLVETRAYDGCQSVDVYNDLDSKGTLVLYEKWDSPGHHKKYMAWRQETGALAQLGAALTGPPIIRYFDRVDA
jgi:quinol monooxygenase YgiN